LLYFNSHFFQLLANGICRGTFVHCAPNGLTTRKGKFNVAHQSIALIIVLRIRLFHAWQIWKIPIYYLIITF
jgi:hypothetical protein